MAKFLPNPFVFWYKGNLVQTITLYYSVGLFFDCLYKWKYVCSLVVIEGMDLIQPPDIFRKRSVTNLANKYM